MRKHQRERRGDELKGKNKGSEFRPSDEHTFNGCDLKTRIDDTFL